MLTLCPEFTATNYVRSDCINEMIHKNEEYPEKLEDLKNNQENMKMQM